MPTALDCITMTQSTPKDFYTLCRLMPLLGHSVAVIRKTADQHGIEPVFHLNGTPYYDGEAIDRLKAALAPKEKPDNG